MLVLYSLKTQMVYVSSLVVPYYLYTASYIDNLYWTDLVLPGDFEFAGVANSYAAQRLAEVMMWHRRFAHVGLETLAWMSSLYMPTGSSLRPSDFLQARRRLVRRE